ncbi:MAG: hypothetical protein ACKV22_20395 [Bryobacteraceae bacterium]
MTIHLKPETEQLVMEELRSGHFRTVDDLIVEGVQAWRQTHPATPTKARKNFAQFLMESPLAGSGLNLERDRDTGRDIDL